MEELTIEKLVEENKYSILFLIKIEIEFIFI